MRECVLEKRYAYIWVIGKPKMFRSSSLSLVSFILTVKFFRLRFFLAFLFFLFEMWESAYVFLSSTLLFFFIRACFRLFIDFNCKGSSQAFSEHLLTSFDNFSKSFGWTNCWAMLRPHVLLLCICETKQLKVWGRVLTGSFELLMIIRNYFPFFWNCLRGKARKHFTLNSNPEIEWWP